MCPNLHTSPLNSDCLECIIGQRAHCEVRENAVNVCLQFTVKKRQIKNNWVGYASMWNPVQWHFILPESALQNMRNTYVLSTNTHRCTQNEHEHKNTQSLLSDHFSVTPQSTKHMHFQSLPHCLGDVSQGSAVTSPNTQGSCCHGSLCFFSLFSTFFLFFLQGDRRTLTKTEMSTHDVICARTIIPPSNWQINPVRKPTKATSTRAQH